MATSRPPLHQFTLRLPVRTCQEIRDLATKSEEGIAVTFRRLIRAGLEAETRSARTRRAVA